MRLARGGAAYGWMTASAALFASMSFFARLASTGTHWTGVAAARALVGAAVGVAVARVRGVPALAAPSPTMWLRSLFGTASMALTFAALSDRQVSMADTVTLLNLSPVFIAVLAPVVLRERAGLRAWIALPLSAAGVALILRPPALFGGGAAAMAPRAVAICVGSAFCAALAMLALRRTSARESPEGIAVHFSLTGFVLLGVAAAGRALWTGELAAPAPSGWLALGLAGLSGGAGQLAMTRAYSLERAARVSPLGYLGVAFSALLGAAFLGEPLSATSAGGMLLVVAGGLLLAWLGLRDAR